MRDKNGKLIQARDIVRIKLNWLKKPKVLTVVMTQEFGLLPLDNQERTDYLFFNSLPQGAGQWGKGKGIFAKPPKKFEVI